MPHERLARQPDHHVAVLAKRPQQGQGLQLAIGLAQDENALGLELVQIIHDTRLCQTGGGLIPGQDPCLRHYPLRSHAGL